MALVRIGIVEIAALKKARRVVYFILLIVASVITPGDVITATIALTIPLALLYELGIFLARPPKAEKV
jgi:sec-independent protein translocase protein TatC